MRRTRQTLSLGELSRSQKAVERIGFAIEAPGQKKGWREMWAEVRPRFQMTVTSDPDVLMDKFRERLSTCPGCTGVSVGRHAELFVAHKERRLWSPWLSITAEHCPSGSLLRGRFAPHPGVWTLYLFFVFGLGFALLVGTAWGYAQWAIEQTPWALLSVPVVLALAGSLYLASIIGQRLGAQQMDQLRATLEELISDE